MSAKLVVPQTPASSEQTDIDRHFADFRSGIVGLDAEIKTPEGNKPLHYFDWTASGRFHASVESKIDQLQPYYANTHSHGNFTGSLMSELYEAAHKRIAEHVNAAPDDTVLMRWNGMTGAVNWFIRRLGLRDAAVDGERPVVLLTKMEHHSNHTSWMESNAEVVLVDQRNGVPDLDHLTTLCERFRDSGRPLYGSFSACSNVTGVRIPYQAMAGIMHDHGGKCFVDFAASAPYVEINMHPADPRERLDAIFFSAHKFLGGPGASGVIVFSNELYKGGAPIDVGGGTVLWTNPWGEHKFHEDIREREDAGTPGALQAFRAALAVDLKEAMGSHAIEQREALLLKHAFMGLDGVPNIQLLESELRLRQPIISFIPQNLHSEAFVTLLNDKFGVQARGGCSCAGTYGHELLGIDRERSHELAAKIEAGDMLAKPGWVRVSLHPTHKLSEVEFMVHAIHEVAVNGPRWIQDYGYDDRTNSWRHQSFEASQQAYEFFHKKGPGGA